MSELFDVEASYCPACGNVVDTAQSTVAESAFATDAQGTYEDAGKHVIVEGAQVSVYVHADQDGDGR